VCATGLFSGSHRLLRTLYRKEVAGIGKFREARLRIGLSQTELAEELDVAQKTVSNWEKIDEVSRTVDAIAVSAFLQIPITDLVPEEKRAHALKGVRRIHPAMAEPNESNGGAHQNP